MRIDDFKKKENPIMKFLNKYLGLKYSVIFLAIKELPKTKPTATSVVSMLLVAYILYFMIRYSRWFLWIVLFWAICYLIQLINKIYKQKHKKDGKRKKNN